MRNTFLPSTKYEWGDRFWGLRYKRWDEIIFTPKTLSQISVHPSSTKPAYRRNTRTGTTAPLCAHFMKFVQQAK